MPPFHPRSFFNEPLPAIRPQLDSRSDTCVAKLAAWVREEQQPITTTGGMWAAGRGSFTRHPFYTANEDTPRHRVTLKTTFFLQPWQQQVCESVPIPDGAVPDTSPDSAFVVLDHARDEVWEFYRISRAADGTFTAAAMGLIRDASQSKGVYDEMCCPPESFLVGSKWGVRASGFSMAAGVARAHEIKAGRIPHALALAVPKAQGPKFSLPALKTDGTGNDLSATAIPYGARFVLPPDFDLDAYAAERQSTEPKYKVTYITRLFTAAMKDFGLIPMDRTGFGVGIEIEDNRTWSVQHPGEPDPYTGLFGGNWNTELRSLPWERLQMLQTDLRS